MNRSPTIFAACASAIALVAACDRTPDATPAVPLPASAAQLSVHEAWARPADSGATTAVYFTLVNGSMTSDTLDGVRSSAAAEASLHMSMQHGNTMHMAAVGSFPVPGLDSVLFVPLGAHVMLTRTTRSFAAGDTVPITLTFVSGQSLEVRARVRRP